MHLFFHTFFAGKAGKEPSVKFTFCAFWDEFPQGSHANSVEDEETAGTDGDGLTPSEVNGFDEGKIRIEKELGRNYLTRHTDRT